MASNRKDVNLVIRAKDEAKKNIDAVKNSLQDLTSTQNDLNKSAKQTDGVLGGLAAELANLNKQAQGLTQLGKISTQLQAAATSVSRFEAALARTKANTQGLVDSYGQIGARVQQLKNQLAISNGALAGQEASAKRAQQELKNLDQQVAAAGRAYNILVAELKKTKAPSDSLLASYRNQQASLLSLLGAQEKAAANSKAQTAAYRQSVQANKELSNSLAVAQRSQAGLRTSAVEATTALREERAALGETKGALQNSVAAANAAATGFHNIVLEQNEISDASKRTAANIDTVTAALQRQKSVKVTSQPVDTGLQSPQLQSLIGAQKAYQAAQAEVRNLAKAVRDAKTPNDELNRSFLLSQAAARTASAEYQRQIDTLRRVGQSAAGSYQYFDQMARGIQNAARAETQLAGATNAAVQPLAQLNNQATRTGNTMRSAAVGTKSLGDEFKRTGDNSRTALSFLQRMRAEVLSLVTGYIGLYAAMRQIGGVVTSFQALEAAQNRLGSVFNQDDTKVARELAFLNSEADRLGISFQILADQYSKISVSAQQANFSVNDTRKLFISVAEAARVNKLSTEQMNGVFLAFTQMINKGKVNSEELSRQLGDRLPGAVNLFATALGYSTAELLDLMKAGDVFADRDTLTKVADRLTDRFGNQLPKALLSLTTQLGRFDNMIYQSQLAVAQGGFAQALTEAIANLNDQLKSQDARKFFAAIGSGLGQAITVLAQLPQYFGTILTFAKAIAAIKFANMFSSFASGAALATAQMQRLSLAAATTGSGLTKVVSRSFISTIGALNTAIGTASFQLTKLQGASIGTRARLAATVGTLSLVRGAALTTAAAFRGLWAALGGFPGLILTSLVYIGTTVFANWKTSTDKINDALSTQQGLLDTLKEKYTGAKSEAEGLKRVVTEMSKAELLLNKSNLEQQLADLRADVPPPLKVFSEAEAGVLDSFREGKINAEELLKAVDGIAAAHPEMPQKYLANLIQAAKNGNNLEDALKKVEAQIRLTSGEATDADKEILGLKGAFEGLDDVLGNTDNMDKWREGLDEIKALIPELSNEMERLKNLGKIDDIVKGMGEPRDIEQLIEQTKLLERARKAVNDESANKAVSGSFASRVSGVESSNNPNAKNPNSTATGLGQFVEGTWNAMFKKYFPDRAKGLTDAAINELRKNAELSNKMIELYAQENAKVLQKAGIAVDDAALYMAHFLGPNGAVKVLSAAAETPIKNLLSQDAIKANPKILGGNATAGSVVDFAQNKMGVSDREVAVAQELEKIDQSRVDAATKFLDTLKKQNEEREFEIATAAESERQQAILKAQQDLMNDARQAGVTLTQSQIDLVGELTAKQYDAANAAKLASEAREKTEKAVNDLLEYRSQLTDLINTYESQGNTQMSGRLQDSLVGVNEQLETAITNAIAMWQAVGGAEADAAIAKLENQRLSVQQLQNEYLMTGKDINEAFAGQGAQALTGWTDKLAEGENVLSSLGDAFLQFSADFLRMIAEMIIKQAIFNAISGGFNGGGGGGGAVAGLIGSIFHEGGIAGRSAPTRTVSPAWFANATRYHTGGIAGLKPNEVPAILQKNEEILTTADPRHQFNGGGGGAVGDTKIINAFDAGSFMSEALSSKVGEKSLLNYVRANSKTFKAAMGN